MEKTNIVNFICTKIFFDTKQHNILKGFIFPTDVSADE